jgi:hypothetical protein
MKTIHSLALGFAALMGTSAGARIHIQEAGAIGAAYNFAVETQVSRYLLEDQTGNSDIAFEARKLEQAAERLPNILVDSPHSFHIQRKMDRISQLFLVVRDGLLEVLYQTESPEAQSAMNRLEATYIDLVLELANEGLLPTIDD